MTRKESYGIDAPGAVRMLGASGCLLLAGAFVPDRVPGAAVAHALWPTSVSLLAGCAWMLVCSLWLKKRVMRSLLDQRSWRGDEVVLDVGCGRGLVTVGIARRVPEGRVHGIDLWQAQDLSGNSPGGLRANAALAGVEDRVWIDTGDARALPYADATFDVVTSMTAIHNIPQASGRREAIAEMWRVLRPGGQMLFFDIRHARAYLEQLRTLGAVDATLAGPILLWGPVGWRAGVTKPAASHLVSGPMLAVEQENR